MTPGEFKDNLPLTVHPMRREDMPRAPRRHVFRELALTGLVASCIAWTVMVGMGVGIFWYTAHHQLPTPSIWALIATAAIPIALVTACAVTLLRTLHLLRMALAALLTYTRRLLSALLFATRTGRRSRDQPPILWL